MNPIGYIRTPFKFKNGTPRQPTVCSHARGSLTIEKTVFNNPEHALIGLEEYSHVWILFIFHKNNNAYTKAKVKPPRLNGKKVGLFSTRCPYRPNNIGLTLAKLDSIIGATVNVSGIDILDGTPVLDIKPYIPQYDCPTLWPSTDSVTSNGDAAPDEETDVASETIEHLSECISSTDSCSGQALCPTVNEDPNNANVGNGEKCDKNFYKKELHDYFTQVNEQEKESHYNEQAVPLEFIQEHTDSIEPELYVFDIHLNDKQDHTCKYSPDIGLEAQHRLEDKEVHFPEIGEGEFKGFPCKSEAVDPHKETASLIRDPHLSEETVSEVVSQTAKWITKPNVEKLTVRFTNTATEQLCLFSEMSEDKLYSLQYLKRSEVKEAIISILKEDPRSTYRRKHCMDNLYYFTVDILHVTCWFDDNVAEVVRVKPAALVAHCKLEYM